VDQQIHGHARAGDVWSAVTKDPAEPDDDEVGAGGRAAERLRDLMRGRLPTDTPQPQTDAPGEPSESDEAGEAIHEEEDQD
jgi:hypothetical protein